MYLNYTWHSKNFYRKKRGLQHSLLKGTIEQVAGENKSTTKAGLQRTQLTIAIKIKHNPFLRTRIMQKWKKCAITAKFSKQ